MRSSLFRFAAPLAALAFASGCGSASDEPIDVGRAEGCNPLGATDECLFPFPSSFTERPDAASPTGVRMSIADELAPRPIGSKPPLDLAAYNLPDGASPVTPILLHFGEDLDTTGLPFIDSVELSMETDCPVALYDLESGARVPFFVENDANKAEGWDGRYAFIVRPVAPMAMGHRHAVFLKKGLKTVSGAELEPTASFAALRDGTPTTSADVERVRPMTEAALAFGDTHGYPRGELLTGWDFQVASEEWLLGSVLSMREKALAELDAGTLGYVTEGVTLDPTPYASLVATGTFEVPTFVGEGEEFTYDEEHHPVRQAETKSYPFTLVVPKRARTSGPLPLVVIGHGIFGEGREYLTNDGDNNAFQKLAQEYGAVLVATDWIGLSGPDLEYLANNVVSNLDRIGYITDQLQQALINTVALTHQALGPMNDDPAFRVADGALIDPSRVYYWGASLGGIEGSGFVTLSPHVERAVFGVPGSAWGTMLTRSSVFPPLKQFISFDYPDPLDLSVITTLAQVRFDHADPANLTTRMFQKPLPGTPADRVVILQEAIGDSQVPNLTTDILARAMGARLITPATYEPYGVEKVPQLPWAKGASVQQFKLDNFDNPAPPLTNTPPESDNGVHYDMNFLPSAQAQIGALFLSGKVVNVCDGECDPN